MKKEVKPIVNTKFKEHIADAVNQGHVTIESIGLFVYDQQWRYPANGSKAGMTSAIKKILKAIRPEVYHNLK